MIYDKIISRVFQSIGGGQQSKQDMLMAAAVELAKDRKERASCYDLTHLSHTVQGISRSYVQKLYWEQL